jgi:hypothetical protein
LGLTDDVQDGCDLVGGRGGDELFEIFGVQILPEESGRIEVFPPAVQRFETGPLPAAAGSAITKMDDAAQPRAASFQCIIMGWAFHADRIFHCKSRQSVTLQILWFGKIGEHRR